jgi:hypothetical protein
MIVLEYLTADTGTIHLARQDVSHRGVKTLCGRDATGMTMGDETLSGHQATCQRCLAIRPTDRPDNVIERTNRP